MIRKVARSRIALASSDSRKSIAPCTTQLESCSLACSRAYISTQGLSFSSLIASPADLHDPQGPAFLALTHRDDLSERVALQPGDERLGELRRVWVLHCDVRVVGLETVHQAQALYLRSAHTSRM